jgi:acyl-lipid omega-6 desaturase (Delta-12 desaturase)
MDIQNQQMTPAGLKATWQKLVAPYTQPKLNRSLLQLANSLIPYLVLWVLMLISLKYSYWLTLVLLIPASGFLVRLFIIFHDCGHGSFFKSKSANRWVGFFLGVLTFMPSEAWWHDHALHHATAGNLDRRGMGDVMTWTVEEYLSAPWFKRAGYRAFRFPLVMFLLGPIFSFLITPRFPKASMNQAGRRSVYLTDLALLILGGLTMLVGGWQAYVLIQLPLMWLAGIAGIWLFYIQHQFEDSYWVENNQWDFTRAAFEGASYYKLPKILQWFSGNIGFHHIHHLSPRIPNYLLEKCYTENPPLQNAPTFTILSGLKALSLGLYDESTKKMVSFSAVRGQRRVQQIVS